ncbi:MAG: hypothetical protein ACW99U_11980 [Candidatus Thorarchaeota archaeon]
MAEIPVADPGAGYGASDERPMGVTILAVLQILGGAIVLFLGGVLGLLAAALLPPAFAAFALIFAAFAVILGLISLVVGYGLWGLKSWAWTWAMIVNVLNIITALLGGNYIGLVIPIIIVLYLNSPDIKRRFR